MGTLKRTQQIEKKKNAHLLEEARRREGDLSDDASQLKVGPQIQTIIILTRGIFRDEYISKRKNSTQLMVGSSNTLLPLIRNILEQGCHTAQARFPNYKLFSQWEYFKDLENSSIADFFLSVAYFIPIFILRMLWLLKGTESRNLRRPWRRASASRPSGKW